VPKNKSGQSSGEPNRAEDLLRIAVDAEQYEWLTKQCAFLNIDIQQLLASALEEWICRTPVSSIHGDPSGMVQRALNEFMRRHRNEFLSIEE
jgi:hypothetical protein